jgi:polyisoprenoid-binding protein YceI
MKKSILLLAFAAIATSGMAQKITTSSGAVSFDATTPTDPLPKADNKTVIASLDKTTGDLAFEAPVNNFTFSNPMMQEHFNGKDWMNSATFPKFTFSGKIDKISVVKFDQNGTYNVTVTGTLTIKDVSKPVSLKGKVTVTDGSVTAASNFSLKLADYGFTGGYIDAGKIATEPKISVAVSFN